MVSGVVLGPGNSSPHHKYVFVKLLTQQTISLSVEPKTRVSEARGLVTSSLHTLGMQDSAIFGLAVKLEDEYVFAEPDIKVSKYAPKAWKTSSNGVDADGKPLLQFSLRVQFYVETHLLLTDEVSQLHYYLQLRENVLTYAQPLSEETLFLLAAYALQADLGDLEESQYHGGQYFQPELYLPQWVLERAGISYAVEQVAALHREHLGLGTSEAHAHYIREASQQEAPHNLHLYRLRHKKHDPVPQVTLAISSKGIEVFEEDPNDVQPGRPSNRAIMAAFQWTNIRQLCFDKKKFEIVGRTWPTKLTFHTTSHNKSKHLLYLCRLTDQLKQKMQPRLCQLPRLHHHSASLESGLESLSRSLSRLDSSSSGTPHPNSPSASSPLPTSPPPGGEDVSGRICLTPPLPPTPPATTAVTSTTTMGGEALGACEAASSSSPLTPAGLARTGSFHSSSSQHSASTVRSRYALLPAGLQPELTLGADLADLSLATTDLGDIGHAGAVDNDDDEDDDDDDDDEVSPGVGVAPHNCCSTCCGEEDAASIASEDDLHLQGSRTCSCGSCTVCILQGEEAEEDQGAAGCGGRHGAYLGAAGNAPPQFYHHTPTFDDASVVVQPDLDDTTTSTYNFSEEDFLQLDNHDDYVEFYKDGIPFEERTRLTLPQPPPPPPQAGLDMAADEVASAFSGLVLGGTPLVPQGFGGDLAEEQQQQLLDFSVESAQASLAASYAPAASSSPSSPSVVTSSGGYPQKASVSSTFDTDSDYVQVPRSEGPPPPPPYMFLQSEAVAMATVTTVTPVAIATSRLNPSASAPLSTAPTPTSAAVAAAPTAAAAAAPAEVVVSRAMAAAAAAAARANASEAQAKFITTRPPITVLKAQTQRAATTAPSASVPLSRVALHTLPQVTPRPKTPAVQSLHRGGVYGLGEGRPLGLPPPYRPASGVMEMSGSKAGTVVAGGGSGGGGGGGGEVPVIRKNNYLDVRASSTMTRHRARLLHPEHMVTATAAAPRSLFLRDQQKALHQQQLKDQQQMQQLQKQLSSETVYQPAAYAQGVGVPLLPSPTYHDYHTHQVYQQSQQQPLQHAAMTYVPQQYQQQQYLQQPYIKNFFQNPPPPAPHPGFGLGACPSPQGGRGAGSGGGGGCGGGSGLSLAVPLEIPSPTYQCASDPGQSLCGSGSSLTPPHPHAHPHPQLATVYTNQVSLSQIEQFKAQLYSDVDYVMYPLKDPAVSRQEYLDAKVGQVLAAPYATYLPPPPPYRSPKQSPMYRSTPNVAAHVGGGGGGGGGGVGGGGGGGGGSSSSGGGIGRGSGAGAGGGGGAAGGGGGGSGASWSLTSYPSCQSLASHCSTQQPGSSSGYSSMVRGGGRYFSQQSLGSSSLSSAPSGYSASTQSLTGSYEPYSDLVLQRANMMRVRSDESILMSAQLEDHHQLLLEQQQQQLEQQHQQQHHHHHHQHQQQLDQQQQPQLQAQPQLQLALKPPPPYRPKESLAESSVGLVAKGGPVRSGGGGSGGGGGGRTGRGRRQRQHQQEQLSSLQLLKLQQLREKSRHLDLPLITALCSDQSLFANARRAGAASAAPPSLVAPPATAAAAAAAAAPAPGSSASAPPATPLIASPPVSPAPPLVPLPLGLESALSSSPSPQQVHRAPGGDGVPLLTTSAVSVPPAAPPGAGGGARQGHGRRYAVAGVYTTNQVPLQPGPPGGKSSVKSTNGVHHHPKSKSREARAKDSVGGGGGGGVKEKDIRGDIENPAPLI